MDNVADLDTVPTPTYSVLPLADDPDCGIVHSNGGGTWIGHVGPGLVFLLWGLWWSANLLLTNFRQSAAGIPYCCQSYYSLPWRHAQVPLWLKHREALTMIWGPLVMVCIELKGDHLAYT